MRVLFLTVSTGQGHISCAKAMDSYLKEQGIETFVLDIYEYVFPLLGKTVSNVYSFASGKIPKIYGQMYKTEERGHIKLLYSMTGINIFVSKKIRQYINDNNIDIVVATHLFAGQLLTILNKSINTINIGIVTDYTIHPHWEDTALDYYITADEGLSRQAVIRGIDYDKIKPFGIPIDLKFAKKQDKKEMKLKLGFNDKPLICFMMGGVGYGDILSILLDIDKIDIDFEIAIVCGKNIKAKKAIGAEKFDHTIYVFGFINNIDELMGAADCLVTKPGGLTLTEALTKNLPMVFVNPIPGQEERNIEFLVNNGVGMQTSETYNVGDALYQFLSNKKRQEEMMVSIKRLSKPYAAKSVGDFIIDIIKRGK